MTGNGLPKPYRMQYLPLSPSPPLALPLALASAAAAAPEPLGPRLASSSGFLFRFSRISAISLSR